MHHAKKRHGIAALIVVLLIAIGTVVSPTTTARAATDTPGSAAAAGEEKSGPLTGKPKAGTQGLPESPLPYDCYVAESPQPTYNSPDQTLHWGVKYLCTEVTVTWVKAQLLEYDSGSWYVQDQVEKNFVGSNWGSPPRAVKCLSRTNHLWKIRAWVTINGVPGIPNPGDSIAYTRPCE